MTGTKWKLATALGVAGAIALSVPSAEARGGRNAAIGFGIAAGALALGAAAAASQPRYHYYDNGYYGGGDHMPISRATCTSSRTSMTLTATMHRPCTTVGRTQSKQTGSGHQLESEPELTRSVAFR